MKNNISVEQLISEGEVQVAMPGFQFFLDYINESYDVDDDFD